MTAELRIGGVAYDGFESGTVRLELETVFNSFDFEYVADGERPGVRRIFAGDQCEIALDGEVVLDGYVDGTEEDDSSDAIRLSAAGRSKTADIADCTAVEAPFLWNSAALETVVQSLCLPFAVEADVLDDLGEPFPLFAVQRGETVADAILRACHRRGKHVYCVGGRLVCASTGAIRTATVLERGVNVIRSSRSDSWFERYSDYVFCAQAAGTSGRWGKSAAQIKTAVLDSGVTRYRPILVQADSDTTADLELRAKLERNRRAAAGERITVTVDGWQTSEGFAWRPNTLVRFRNPVLGVDADLLVIAAAFRLGAREPKETELVLGRPEAFDVTDYPTHGRRGDSWT
jgi:prophage tail gpP-like protein